MPSSRPFCKLLMAGLLCLIPGKVASQQATELTQVALTACCFAELATSLHVGRGRQGILEHCNSGTVTGKNEFACGSANRSGQMFLRAIIEKCLSTDQCAKKKHKSPRIYSTYLKGLVPTPAHQGLSAQHLEGPKPQLQKLFLYFSALFSQWLSLPVF